MCVLYYTNMYQRNEIGTLQQMQIEAVPPLTKLLIFFVLSYLGVFTEKFFARDFIYPSCS